MSSTALPYTLTYRNPGAEPPIFLAGNFTDAEWGLQEMSFSREDGGEYVFESRILVELGREYQFKFKAGKDGPWVLDESRTTATDEMGDRNNVLKLSKSHVSKIKDEAARRTSTPIEQVASVAAEVADTAAKLDEGDSSSPQISGSGGESEIDEDLKTPLFAHECFGAYEFVDDALDHDALDDTKLRRDSKPKLDEYAIGDVDINDPTIEQFPSDKSEIFSTLRKIQSSLTEDQVSLDDSQASPRLDGRRTSVDSDDSLLSAGSLSPVTARRRENRMSTSSGRNRSLVSLGSIAEEPKTPGPVDASHPIATSNYSKKDAGLNHAKSSSIEQAANSVCLRCIHTIRSRPFIQTSVQPCLSQRFLSQRVQERPSRMILADQVHRTPRLSRDDRKPRRERVDGPFSGMNRTVANFDPSRASTRARSAHYDDRKSSQGKDKWRPQNDRKALKMQRALASVSYNKRTSVKERMQEYESFDQFDLLPALKTAAVDEVFAGMVDIRPTPVQRLAIPALLGQREPGEQRIKSEGQSSFLLAAETGSGKTLAYLLPAIDALKIAEAKDTEIQAYKERAEVERQRQKASDFRGKSFEEPHPTMSRPRIVVLVPTAELAHQVGLVAKKLSHVVKFKTEILASNLKPQQIQRHLYGPKGLDVIISTPHLLASIADSDPNILSRVSHLIIDEADSLFDRSFSSVTSSIVERSSPSMKQLICCSATIPRKLNNYLATNYPKMIRITTPNLHAIPRRVQLGVIDVSKDPYRNNKDLACADVIYTIGREASQHENLVKDEIDVRRVMVFVNEREKTEKVAEYLRSKGIDAEALHRDTPEKRHGEILETFTSSQSLRIIAPPNPSRHRSLPNVKALVVTDLASRGIDTLAVRHVILYDVPHTTIDFIHRLGRAGRMGRRGRGIVLVGNDDRRDVVADVKKSIGRGGAARAGKAAVARLPSAEPINSSNAAPEEQKQTRGRPRGRPRKTPSVARLSINEEDSIRAANRIRDEALDKLANGDATTANEATAMRTSSRSSIELGRYTAATPGHNRRDTSGLDLGDSVFGDLDDSFADGDIPGSARSGDTSTMSYSALRTQSRRSSFIGRNDAPIRPSSRSGNTPRVGSSFNIGLFKRRAREPSILGTNRKPLQEPPTVDQDSEGDNEEDFEPEAESTPLNNRRRTRGDNEFAEPESPEGAESSNPRKRKSLEAQQSSTRPEKVSRTEPGPSRQPGERGSSELSDAPPSPQQNQVDETSESELSDVSSPRGPPPGLPQRPVTPVNQEEIAAPPASSGSEGPDAWPDIRSLAKKRRRPSITTPTRLENLSDMSSPPSLTHSPNYDTVKPGKTRGRPPQRQQASPKITTADLTSLLPKRRYKKSRDPLGLESDEELDTSGLGHEDDELSHLDTQTARRRKRGRPPTRAASVHSTSRGGKAGGSSLQSKRTTASTRSASRAVRSRSRHSSDKENAEDNDRGSDHNESENGEAEEESRFIPLADNMFDGAGEGTADPGPTEELKQASNKFKEVDKWQLDFEEVTEASSPQDGR
ncbi:P-loop containing nucleoside triphosphate hydrolase protein [Trichoderma ceciliae]